MEFAYFYVNVEQIHLPLFHWHQWSYWNVQSGKQMWPENGKREIGWRKFALRKIRWGWEGHEESSMKCASWECNRKQFQHLRYVCSSEVLKKAASKIRCTLRKLKLVFIVKLAIERRHLRGCEQSQGRFGAPLRGHLCYPSQLQHPERPQHLRGNPSCCWSFSF